MSVPADESLVFSSKKRVFRVLSVDEVGVFPIARPSPRRVDAAKAGEGTALWLSPAMEQALDEWAAAQPDPKPGRMEAVRRLLDQALSTAAS